MPLNVHLLPNISLTHQLILAGPGREILVEGWKALRRGAPDMNSLVGMGACAAWTVSCVAVGVDHNSSMTAVNESLATSVWHE